jgi:hypothetical protein
MGKYDQAVAEFKEKVASPQWTVIPTFPAYEQNVFGHVRVSDTKNKIQPHVISKERRDEGMFVDLWRDGASYIVSLDALYEATFGKKR